MKSKGSEMKKPLLLGCGILQKEIHWLIDHNSWELDTAFFRSSLHINFDKLSHSLTAGLKKYQDRDCIVFYGACHPLMDQILDAAHTFRTNGVNCIEMLLGEEKYQKELAQGAFFLLEDWALKWDKAIAETFGGKEEVIRAIFQNDRKYILIVRTPVSCDFSKEAAAAAKRVALPLRTMDVSLEHLGEVLNEALDEARRRKSEKDDASL